MSYERQRKSLRNGADVVVACPGRLEDLMQTGTIRLADVRTVVLDEADRMADMGFLPAVRRILDATAPQRQTLLYSATLDGEVDVLVRHYQKDPVRHEVVNDADDLSRVTHAFHHVAHADRPAALAELAGAATSSIIFVRTKHGADRVATKLAQAGIAAQAIHGGRSQAQRERTLKAFRAGRVHALVATDVAARGIHVDDVATVIHYDLPESPKDYVHRSGKDGPGGSRRGRHRARHARTARDGRRPPPHARPRRHRRRRGPPLGLGRRRPPRCSAPQGEPAPRPTVLRCTPTPAPPAPPGQRPALPQEPLTPSVRRTTRSPRARGKETGTSVG